MRGSYTKQKKKGLFPDAEEVEEIGDGSAPPTHPPCVGQPIAAVGFFSYRIW